PRRCGAGRAARAPTPFVRTRSERVSLGVDLLHEWMASGTLTTPAGLRRQVVPAEDGRGIEEQADRGGVGRARKDGAPLERFRKRRRGAPGQGEDGGVRVEYPLAIALHPCPRRA